MSTYTDRVAGGCCGKCGKQRRVGDGGTLTMCEGCGDQLREYRRDHYRLRMGIPIDAPKRRLGRPRTSYQGPPSPPRIDF